MNARALSFFERTPGGWAVAWLAAVFFGGGVALMAIAFAATGNTLSPGWHSGFLVVSAALLLPLPFLSMAHLHAQRGVWLGRVAPLSAWRLALVDHRHTLLISWALAALPLVLQRLLTWREGDSPVATALFAAWPLAALSGWLGVGLLLAAALAGSVAWPWAGVAAVAMAAVAMAAPWLQGADSLGAVLATVCAALLGPLALQRVHNSLQRPPARSGALLGPGPWRQLSQTFGAFSERFRVVDGPAGGGIVVSVLVQWAIYAGNPYAGGAPFQAWGSSVSALHALRLLLFTALAAALLRGAVLHWRVLLAPGGSVRRHIGLRVVGSTLLSLLIFVGTTLALIVLVWACLPLSPAVPWQQLPAVALRHALPLLADLALAVALAAWLRAALGSPQRVLMCRLAAALLWLLVVFAAAPMIGVDSAWQRARAELWHRGLVHHAISFALAGVFTLLAQRAWLKADLHELARRSPENQERMQRWH